MLSFFSSWRLRSLALMGLLLVFASCGTFSSTSTTTQTCLADKPELRFWARDQVAVALNVSTSSTLKDDQIAADVGAAIQSLPAINPSTLDFVPPLIRVGSN